MKKIIIALIMIIPTLITPLYAEVGCIDNSYHLRKCPDNKEYHYVHCTCPCWRYKQSFIRGRCAECWHFHIPKEIVYIKADDVIAQEARQKNQYCSNKDQ